ncbi:MAG: hypothetical protein LQ340_000967, partial [Diploschistes diacapsis]
MDFSDKAHLYGFVDIGSNGIRFSISDLTPSTARILPTVYQDRCGVSLYDTQYQSGTKAPIPEPAIQDVIRALSRFKSVCVDFEVPESNIRVVATEATREAINSSVFRQRISDATGWIVEILGKEDEGRIGALGIASSFSSLEGLVLDLGGGSVQITWIISRNGRIETCPRGSVSLPYGAAALMVRLKDIKAKGGQDGEAQLGEDITRDLKQALSSLAVPEALLTKAKAEGGLNLYLSGGGFRGWGYLLMSQHPIQP